MAIAHAAPCWKRRGPRRAPCGVYVIIVVSVVVLGSLSHDCLVFGAVSLALTGKLAFAEPISRCNNSPGGCSFWGGALGSSVGAACGRGVQVRATPRQRASWQPSVEWGCPVRVTPSLRR
jgi:hypothetical protein